MRYIYALAVVLTALCCGTELHADDNPLAPASWIAMEPADTVVAPLVHAPFVKKELAGVRVGEYQMPVFLRNFTVRKNLRRATLYVCGLGHFEAYLDGQKVGDHFLDPGWTLYDREALYVTFDVTRQLAEVPDNAVADFVSRWKRGEHELRVELGGGFYNVPRGRYNKLMGSYGQPKLRLRLHLEYRDGKEEDLVSDGAWRVSRSQVTYSSIYGGEDVDLRIEPEWQPALNLGKEGPALREQQGTEVVVWGVYEPLSVKPLPNGDYLYDFGQNMSGIPEVTLQGRQGQNVSFIPSELTADDGSAYNKPVGNWQYQVTLADVLPQTLHPKFSYTGFRYLQVHGAVPEGMHNPQTLAVIKQIRAMHTTSVTAREETGTFHCNNEAYNQIHHIIDWAIRSNLQSVITDCPHREKLGWLEQDYLMMPSMLYRYDVGPIYRKLMNDMEASQFAAGETLGLASPTTTWLREGMDLEGMIPTIAPYYTRFGWDFDETPEWGSAFIISPWYYYEWTGSDELFRQHFPAMQHYVEYLTRRARPNGYLLEYGLGDWYDLGPAKPGYSQLTSQGVTATATYYYDVKLMAQMADILGQQDNARYYQALADTIYTAYNQRFYHADSCYYDRNSQTANAISLYVGLVPDEARSAVLEHLVEDALTEHTTDGMTTLLTAGDIGYRYLLQALTQGNRHDVIAHLNERDDVPGYLMQLRKGATTLTESWQALPRVSNNHLMLGHLLEWMYGYLGGIRQVPGTVGWSDVLIAPCPVPGITDCEVSYKTPRGPVRVHWVIRDQKCEITYTAPKSMKVRVVNPATVNLIP